MNNTSSPRSRSTAVEKFARGVVKSRFVLFVLFAAALVYCALSLGKVRLNGEIASFLPKDSETRRAMSVMNDEFTTYAGVRVMAEDISFENASAVAEKISAIGHVTAVAFDSSSAHYKDRCALYDVSFDFTTVDDTAAAVFEEVRSAFSGYTYYFHQGLNNSYSDQLAKEMISVVVIAAVVIFAVLLFTSRSYFEVLIYFVVFSVAALLNMGTNHLLGEISTITNSVAVILQLALAIDYAIIFSHRFQSERANEADHKEALVRALAHSIREIFSSSLTTIAGLTALTLMQFRLGRDLGVVLAKGILCSMLTVFLLMPGLMLLCAKPLLKTAHRSFVPRIDRFGRFIVRSKVAFALVFAVFLPIAAFFASNVNYAFNNDAISQIVESEDRTAGEKINAVFSPNTVIAMIVPKGDYEKERAILAEARTVDGVDSAVGLADITILPGKNLTDGITYKEAAALFGADEAQVRLLFAYYASSRDRTVVSDLDTYAVPILDLALFLFELSDRAALPLDGAQLALLENYRGTLENGAAQLSGKTKDRLVFSCSYAPEADESAELLEKLRAIGEKQYGKGEVIFAGDVTASRDLKNSFKGDSTLISVLSIVFVFLILLGTFRSVVASAILVFVIQGSIWINFSFAYFFSMRPSFVTQMIVSAIQMGATIDYAIVFMSRYLAGRKYLPPKEAVVRALDDSFPTVLTSGVIMTVAALIIAFRVSDVYVGHIGLGVGRGAAISVLLVLTVLPQIVALFDRAIMKTTFRLPFKKKKEDETPSDN